MPGWAFDSNVLVAYLLQEQTDNHYTRVKPYVDALRTGQAAVHMPQLGLLEVCGAIRRRAGLALALSAKTTLLQWVEVGSLAFHDLDESRTKAALEMAIDYGLTGADATFAALSQETNLSLVTLDDRSLASRLRGGGYTLVVVP